MAIRESAYGLVVHALRAVAPLAARGDSKLALGIRGRRDAATRLVRWAREMRDPARPLAWFHAPSVGEGFQARAVARALLRFRPDLQVVYTWFSPSAVAFADRMPADCVGYLPWDLPGEVGGVLDALRPDLIAFTKTEVWPVLSVEARERDVPLFLIGASLPPGAGRLRPAARWFLRPTYGRLEAVAAIAVDDAERFPALGVDPERVVVTGDPGIDSAVERARAAESDAPHLRPFRARPTPTVVAGSTWPPDENRLVPAVTKVRDRVPDLRLIIAPHEPTAEHVEGLTTALRKAGWRVAPLGDVEAEGGCGDAGAVVVDRVGVLAELYTAATVAYVGGGFHDQGLHSVLEPAAAGVPVVFGPAHGNARAAGDLLTAGGARTARSEDELARIIEGWLTDPVQLHRAGDRARAYIERHLGAARRTAEVLADALPQV